MANESVTVTQTLDQVTVVSEGPVGLNAGGTISGALNVGADGNGHDVKFFGDGTGKYMQWDADTDKLFINGELEINGSATTFNSTVVTIDDPVFTLGGQEGSPLTGNDSKDRGIEFFYNDGAAKRGFMGYDDSADAFTFLTSATNSNEVFSGTEATIHAGTVKTPTIGTQSGNLTLAPAGTYINFTGKRLYGSNVGLGYHLNAVSAQYVALGAGIDSPTASLSRTANGTIALGNGTQNDASGTLHVGAIGVGTTSPAGEVEIQGTGDLLYLRETGREAATITGQGNGSGSQMIFKTHSGSALSEAMRILPSGNVGINQTSPTAFLHIGGGVSDTYAKIGYYWTFASNTLSSSGALKLNAGSGENIHLQENGTDRLVVKHTTGNVGIGVAAPAAKLDVTTSLSSGATLDLFKSALTSYPSNSDVKGAYIELTDDSNSGNSRVYGIDVDITHAKNHASNRIYGVHSVLDGTGSNNQYAGYFESAAASGYTGDHGESATLLVNGKGTAHIFRVEDNDTGVFTILDGGNVGIGTSAASELLHVSSATSHKPVVVVENTNADSSGTFLRMLKNTASPAVNDSIGSLQYQSNNDQGGGRVYAQIAARIHDPVAATATGELKFNTFVNGTDTTVMTMLDGHVGIGTAAPTADLTVQGSSTTNFKIETPSGSGSGYIDTLMGNTPKLRMYQSSGNRLEINPGDGNINRFNSSNAAIDFSLATNGGNVGIGVTAPSHTLTVVPPQNGFSFVGGGDVGAQSITNSTRKFSRVAFPHYTNAQEPVLFMVGDSDQNYSSVSIGGGTNKANAATQIKFYTAANTTTVTGTERMLIDESGKVGIGTSSPASILHVEGATPTVTVKGTGSSGPVVQLSGTYTNWTIENQYAGGANNDMFRIRNSALSADALVINRGNNKVGIGNTNPIYTLDITGGIRWSGNSEVNGNTTFYDGTLLLFGNSNDFQISHTSNHNRLISLNGDIRFSTNSTERLRIEDSTGLVRIFGNLQVDGTTTTVNSTTVTVDDPVLTLGGDTAPSSDDNKDRGIEFRYYDGSAKVGFMGWDDSAGGFTLLKDATNSSEVFSGTAANLTLAHLFADNVYSPFLRSSVASDTNIHLDGTNDMTFNIHANATHFAFNAGGSEKARLTSAGNLGLSNTNPAQKLSVTGSAAVSSTLYLGSESATGTRIQANSGVIQGYYTTGADARFHLGRDAFAGGYAGLIMGGSGGYSGIGATTTGNDLLFSTNMASAAGGIATERMRIDSAGNVGIGTTSVAYPLHINGATTATLAIQCNGNNAEGSKIRLIEGSANFQGGFIHYDGSANALNIGVHATNNTTLSDDTNVITIPRDTGNLGLGVAAPATKVHILNGTSNDPHIRLSDPNSSSTNDATGYLEVYHGNTTGRAGYFGMITNAEMAMATTTSSGKLCLYTGTGVKAVTIDNSQRFGLGTSSPTGKLHVNVPNHNTVSLQLGNDSYTGGNPTHDLLMLNTGTMTWYLPDDGSTPGDLQFYSRHTTSYPFAIDSENARVGVGTTSPLGKLHVKSASAGSFTYDTNSDDLIVESNSNGGITIATAAGNVGRLVFASPDDPTGAEIRFSQTGNLMKVGPTTPNADLVLQAANSTEFMRLDASTGRIGVLTSTPSFDFDIHGDVRITDNKILRFGEGDLQIHHNAVDSQIYNFTGHLTIGNFADDKSVYFKCDDGNNNITTYFELKGISADGTNTYTVFPDNSRIALGTQNDFQLFHNGSNTRLVQNTGELSLEQQATDQIITLQADNGSGGITPYLTVSGSREEVVANKPLVQTPASSSDDPTNNGELIFTVASNTSIKVKYKGTDGQVRTTSLTLS